MTKNNVLNKALLFFVILLSIICFGIFSAVDAEIANAGNINTTLYQDNFNDVKSSSVEWATRDIDKLGISYTTSEKPVLWMQKPAHGDALYSKVPISDTSKLSVELDIKYIDFGDEASMMGKGSGWLGVIYNVESTKDETAYNAEQYKEKNPGDGIRFFFNIRSEGKLLFTTINNTETSFVDGNGNVMQSQSSFNGNAEPFYDASAILDKNGSGEALTTITNKTLIFKFAGGNVEIYYKSLGASGDGQLLTKSTGGKMEAITSDSFVALVGTICDNHLIESIEITDMRILDSSNSVINSFSRDNFEKFTTYKHFQTQNFTFDFDNSLLISDEFSSTYPYLISNYDAQINKADDFYSYMEFAGSFRLNSINDQSKFGMVVGQRGATRSVMKRGQSSFFYFTDGISGLKAGIETYHKNDVQTEIMAPKSFVLEDDVIDFIIRIDNKGKITYYIDGVKIYESVNENEGYGTGNVGFGLLGDSAGLDANVLEVKFDNQYYVRPENDNLVANFDNDEYNVNEWDFKSSAYMDTHTNTAYFYNGKLVFHNNASGTRFATKKQYSDFYIQMDVSDIRREVAKDVSGNKNYPISNRVAIYWGVPYSSQDSGINVGSKYPLVYIEPDIDPNTWDRKLNADGTPSPIYIRAQGAGMSASVALSDHYDYWSKANADKILQFKVEVIGRDVKVMIKYTVESEWFTALQVQTNEAVVGNVGIAATGHNIYREPHSTGYACGFYSVDNILVKNLDDSPNLVKVGFETNKLPFPKDFNYVDKNNDNEYLIGGDQGCNSSIDASAIGMVSICACLVVVLIKKARRAK